MSAQFGIYQKHKTNHLEINSDVQTEFCMLPTDSLQLDPSIQRTARPAHVAKLAGAWSMAKCQPLAISERNNGDCVIVCGQHRYLAAQIAEIDHLPCVLYRGLTPEEESRLFLSEDNRLQITPYDRLVQRMNSGDEVALAIGSIVQKAGYVIAPQSVNDKAGHIRAISALEGSHGKGTLSTVLRILSEAFPDRSQDGLTGVMINGLSLILAQYPNVDTDRLASTMRRAGIAAINQKAYALKATGTFKGSKAWGQAMIELYNNRLRRGRLFSLAA